MTSFISMLGWAFLPGLATSWAQTIYYGITIRAGDPRPTPGTARYSSHRRVIHMLVVSAYLAYTIYEADHEIRAASSFYADLGVDATSTEREIKSRFRRLAALHHPDKAGGTGDSSQAAADYFMHLKTASETLQDAARRFAYERFGPDVVRWQRCSSVRDYVSHGVLHGVLPHYAVAASAVYVLGLLGYMDFARFYRWLLVALVLSLELHAVTRPRFPPFLDAVNRVVAAFSSRPAYLPFQIVALARKLTVTVYIALSQIGPLLVAHLEASGGGKQPASASASASASSNRDPDAALAESLDRLDALAANLDRDAARLVDVETAPFKNDPAAAANLRGKMREWLVQNTIRADPMVRDAVGSSFRRRRIDAPAGARGTR
ncbi:DnaJ domain [Geosmithia morbida]|uniref:DnaJ domain n=1 Tax=Geosmithia morbida TaxID=1094350 RepID=A0A9P4Z1M1_9HYPO|nr:DnaJ domain [Geosmithia morbida]KAF4125752.1 DnaJ domain [Geosmithia morbida]